MDLCSSEKKKLAAPAISLAVLLLVAAAATMAAAQVSLCSMSEEGLRACKPYISKAAKPEEMPTEACCTPLKQANLTCLCSYKNSDMLPLLGIDPNLAMKLPAKCNITSPDQC